MPYRFGILIPAYNPDLSKLNTLLKKIVDVCHGLSYKIVVVNDGSDNLLNFSLPFKSSIIILNHLNNLGKGEALRTGFRYFSNDRNIKFVLTMDADLQHPPEKIPDFIDSFIGGSQDIIIGVRSRTPGIMPFHRIISNTFTSLIVSLFSGKFVRDSQCGFRLVKSRLINLIEVQEKGFHFESEFLIKCGWHGASIGFVPIPTIYEKEKSSINNFRDTLNFVVLILRLLKERTLGWSLPPAEMK